MKKLRKKGGFTLVESLCVLLVVLLVGFAILSGMQFAADILPRSVSLSRAQVLCSTLKTVVSEELRSAGTVYVDGEGEFLGIFSTHYGGGQEGISRFGAVDGSGADADAGEITLGGRRVLGSTAYAGAEASVSVDYDRTENCFTAVLTVFDGGGREVKSVTFDVLPVERPAVVTMP